VDILTPVLTGFGLAGPAGFNAYLPLLIVALSARFTGLFKLTAPYDIITNWWVIGILVVLVTVEFFADKIPAADSVNDAIQTVIRPASGGFLFLASTGLVTDINPVVAALVGVLTAGAVHAVKASARPVITLSTAGIGNPFVSLIEDIISAGTSIVALIAPIAAVLLFFPIVIFFVAIVLWLRHRFKQRKE
jgi:Domain of unknown function (DUF4126)